MAAGDWRARLRQAIEDAIRIYEPRLSNVHVKLVEDTQGFERMIRFRIEATLLVDAVPEAVTFDSQLESATRVVLVADR
jgi:type VI secretion system lysozyme-like protein